MININKNKLSKEVLKKFQTEDNTFIRAVKQSQKDLIELEIGDIKTPEEFLPQAKIKRWDNEANFSLRWKNDHLTDEPTLSTVGKTIKYKKGTQTFQAYELDPGDIGEDGGLEIEIKLDEKPDTNVFEFTIQTKELDFFYQPALTQEYQNGFSEQFQKEIIVTETDVKDLEGNVLVHRPEHIVDSFAVYHKSKGGMNQADGMEYKTGKAFHSYKPEAKDAQGDKTWCELSIDAEKGILTVTVPQEFLNVAVYPVIVDPTFGYTSAGASFLTSSGGSDSEGAMRGVALTGTISEIAGYFKAMSAGNATYNLDLRNETSNKPGTTVYLNSGSVAMTNTTVALKTYSGSFSMVGANYWVYGYPAFNGVSGGLAYDTTGGSSGSNAVRYDFGSWSTANSYNISIYATYTASGGTAYTRSVAENVKITESTSKILSFIRNRSEAITATDSLKTAINGVRSLSDSLTAADSLRRTMNFSRSQSDISSISESSILSIQINRGNFEGISIQDVISRFQSSFRANSDTTTTQDVVAAGSSLLIFLQEMQVISDALQAEISIGVSVDGEDGPIIESIVVSLSEDLNAGVYDDHKIYNSHTPYYSAQSNDVSPTVLEKTEDLTSVDAMSDVSPINELE